jgi:hypothetical protein
VIRFTLCILLFILGSSFSAFSVFFFFFRGEPHTGENKGQKKPKKAPKKEKTEAEQNVGEKEKGTERQHSDGPRACCD